jgi:hypothetical protein
LRGFVRPVLLLTPRARDNYFLPGHTSAIGCTLVFSFAISSCDDFLRFEIFGTLLAVG